MFAAEYDGRVGCFPTRFARARSSGREEVVVAIALVCVAACSPGVGRPGTVPDSGAPSDTGVSSGGGADAATDAMDAAQTLDAGVDASDADPIRPVDAGEADAGITPGREMTGVYGILNDASPLVAREVDGQIMLVVGGFPYIYFGAIDDEGFVDATGPVLEEGGCPQAFLRGQFGRSTGAYIMTHRTCNARLEQIEGEIRGSLDADFLPAVSGIYDLQATVELDLMNCAPPGPASVRYAVDVLPDGRIQAFVVQGPSAPSGYFGLIQPNGQVANLERLLPAQGGGLAMRLVFSQETANDPVRLNGFQDLYDAERACAYRVSLDGVRI